MPAAGALAIFGFGSSLISAEMDAKRLRSDAKSSIRDVRNEIANIRIAGRRDVRDNAVARDRQLSRMRAVLAAAGGSPTGALSDSSILLAEAEAEFNIREERIGEDTQRAVASLVERGRQIRKSARRDVRNTRLRGLLGGASSATGTILGNRGPGGFSG